MSKAKVIFLCLLVLCSGYNTHSSCGHKENLVKELVPAEQSSSDGDLRSLFSSSHPFKIHVDTSNLKGLSEDKMNYLTKLVVLQGNSIFANKIGVSGNQTIKGDSRIQNACTYKDIVSIPNKYSSYTVDGDFLLFLATKDTGKSGTIAYASACYTDKYTGRPLVGFVVFNPYYLDPLNGKLDNDVATYVHEVLHALVFSRQLFEKFPKVNGQAQYYVYNTNYFLRGFNLLRVAKDHFKCSRIKGLPLEDDGGDGSKGGHFERIVFGDETMVAEDVAIAKFSKMTLALLKDSGWYNIDLSKGDFYTWGKGEGCELFYKTCNQSNVSETCDSNNNFGCDKSFKYKMYCKKSAFTNKCQIKTKGSNCLKKHKDMYFFESTSLTSRCQNLIYKGKKLSGCLDINCAADKKSYVVQLKSNNSDKYTCNRENQMFKWGDDFEFECENPQIICNDLCPKSCLHRGKCLENGKCSCDPFYTGEICGTFAGCYNLPQNLCNQIISKNLLDTTNYSNSFTSDDYDSNYLNYSSWTDKNSSGKINTDTGYRGRNNTSIWKNISGLLSIVLLLFSRQ